MTTTLKILTDSSIQLTQEEKENYDITIIPLSVEINGHSYVDGEEISREELVDQLRQGNIPKTSQPAVGRFVEAYDSLGADGSEVIAIMMSDVLSGTCETAKAAASMTDTKVTVINSKATDRGLAFQVLAAAKDVVAGKSVDDIIAHCKDIHQRTTTDVLIDNLDCLVAGGRVSKMAGMLTKLINLKVIVRLRENSLDMYSKGRSRKLFLKHAKEIAEHHLSNPIKSMSLSNVGTDSEFLKKLADTILPEGSNIHPLEALTSPIIMTHTGLNAVGVITLAEKAEPASNK